MKILATDCLYHQIDAVGKQDDPANDQSQCQSYSKGKCGEDDAIGTYRNHPHGPGQLPSRTGTKGDNIRNKSQVRTGNHSEQAATDQTEQQTTNYERNEFERIAEHTKRLL